MNSSVNPALLDEAEVASAVNCQIKDQLLTTRDGVRDFPLVGSDKSFRNGGMQGASFYNPSKGQSQQTFGDDNASIVVVADSVMHNVKVSSLGPRIAEAEVIPIERITETNHYHLSWVFQAENYIISQDGNNKTLIWDGEGSARFSKGYDTEDKPNSELANGASVGVYAHGRIIQVSEGRKVLVNDFLHKNNLSSPENILQSTEQQYLITGSFFSPPSSFGDIMAGAILPLKDTTHGHADVMMHGPGGVFSLDVSIPDRDSWSTRQITRHVLLEVGAEGPYAIALYDGDQIFRSRAGIQTLRSAAAESQSAGTPQRPISDPVNIYMNSDYEPFLRFTSLAKWAWRRKAFCTVSPWVQGEHRGSRGAVAINFSPVGSQQVPAAWEGLITMPPEFPNIVQFVNGIFDGRDRLFAICNKRLGLNKFENHLVEFDPSLKHDVLDDGTKRRISCKVDSRLAPVGSVFQGKGFGRGTLFFKNVEGELDWGVWARTKSNAPWVLWRKGKVSVASESSEEMFESESVDRALKAFSPQDVTLQLGEAPREISHGRHIQVRVRWKGYAQLEGMRIGHEQGDPGGTHEDDAPSEGQTAMEIVEDGDDFEYSSDENRWEDQ